MRRMGVTRPTSTNRVVVIGIATIVAQVACAFTLPLQTFQRMHIDLQRRTALVSLSPPTLATLESIGRCHASRYPSTLYLKKYASERDTKSTTTSTSNSNSSNNNNNNNKDGRTTRQNNKESSRNSSDTITSRLGAFWKTNEQQQQQSSQTIKSSRPGENKSSSIATTNNNSNNNKNIPQQQQLSLPNQSNFDPKVAAVIVAAILIAGLATLAVTTFDLTYADVTATVSAFVSNPQLFLQDIVKAVRDFGPAAPFIFGLVYLIAEIFALPATPLTLSAGYLFGLTQGVTVVLVAATLAACVAFYIGKTFLRQYVVENFIAKNDKFKKLDKAIGREGFKLLFLVRLSPIFPFSLSNYLYGASSIKFPSYFWGTLLGFTPGTIGYVYTGMVGQALTLNEGTQPWYIYAGGLAVLVGVLKLATSVASDIIASVED